MGSVAYTAAVEHVAALQETVPCQILVQTSCCYGVSYEGGGMKRTVKVASAEAEERVVPIAMPSPLELRWAR